MSRRKGNGLQLPFALQQELGIERNNAQKGYKNSIRSRKDQRRASRVEKKQHVRGGQSQPHGRRRADFDDEDEDEDHVRHVPAKKLPPAKQAVSKSTPKPVSILKKSAPPSPDPPSPSPESDNESQESDDESESSDASSHSSSPGLVLDAGSRSYKDKQAEEDADIAALEKRLGLRGKKRGKTADDDGLGDLLGELDEEDEYDDQKKRKREGDDWLKSKRRKAAQPEPESDDTGSELDEEDMELGSDIEDDFDDGDDDGEDFSGFDSDQKAPEDAPPARIRENPYVAPVTATASTSKYIPPSLRKAQSANGQSLERLRRQVQGQLNKLSESNIISILDEVEKLYRTNPRQDMTSTLIDLILSSFCTPAALQNTFVILHASFISAIYKVIGIDFAASLLRDLVSRFSTYHTTTVTTKEPLNLISLLSNLFTFNVVGSPLVYSFIQLLVSPLSESNSELLLRLIRDCGPQLRQSDPSALKNIVLMTQSAMTDLETKGQPISVRMKFMLETITDLKNNKLRESTTNSGLTREHITRMRKALGSLSSRSLRGTEPLRITLDDIQNSDKKGEWWRVGARWDGHDHLQTSKSAEQDQDIADDDLLPAEDREPDYSTLARTYSLTTPLSISIFTAIASSPNAITAHAALLKLPLKNAQLPEIPRVVLRCCAAEPSYNPFYFILSKRLCSLGDKSKKVAKAFEFAAWGFLSTLR